MIAKRMRRTVGSAACLLRLSGWTCVWLVLPLRAAVGQEADGHRQSAVPPMDKILATLRPEHPRVLATSQTFEAVRASVRDGSLPARIYAEVKKSADQVLDAPVSKYEIPDGNPDQGPDQNPKAVAKIVKFESTPQQALAVVDLTQAYRPHADRATTPGQIAAKRSHTRN
jgi:hypothetical protein